MCVCLGRCDVTGVVLLLICCLQNARQLCAQGQHGENAAGFVRLPTHGFEFEARSTRNFWVVCTLLGRLARCRI